MLGNGGAYDPAYLQSAYNAPSSDHGTGKTVAIVDAFDDPTAEADLATYWSHFGLSACTTGNGCFSKMDEFGGTFYPSANSGWSLETALDLDMVSAVCPNCHILLVEGDTADLDDLATAEQTAYDNGADVISNSWGVPDQGYGPFFDDAFDLGIPVLASSGDTGYGVNYPASSKNVVAVGGTHLVQTTNNGTRSATETTWSGAGSGCDSQETKPAWQSDPNCTGRTVADVSAVADPTTPVWMYQGGGWYEAGGTSAAAPIVASFYAMAARSVARAASLLYAHSDSLNDITSGSNGSCGGSYFCTAQVGYDGPTGLGTPNGITAFGGQPTPPSNTALPSLSGTLALGATISTSAGTWLGSPTITYGYQWQRCDANGDNCADIGGASSDHYVAADADVGSTLRVVVTATNYLGSAQATSDASVVVEPMQPPLNDVTPTIVNDGDTGVMLQSEGTWSGSDATTTTYQWRRCDADGNNCVDIDGETADNYQFVTDDVGSSIRVVVTKSNDAGTGTGTSDAVAAILPPVNDVVPTIVNVGYTGAVLQNAGTWSGSDATSTTYQWQRCDADGNNCVDIDSATDDNYQFVIADSAHTVRIVVSETNDAGTGVGYSDPYLVTDVKPATTVSPAVSGSAIEGRTVTSTTGTWTGTATIAYTSQWYRCSDRSTCSAIAGATHTTYLVGPADVGKYLQFWVNASNTAGLTVAKSALTAKVAKGKPLNMTLPKLSGTAKHGVTVKTNTGTWRGTATLKVAGYQWYRCSRSGGSCKAITGAKSSSYVLTLADRGHTVRAKVTEKNSIGSTAATSAATKTVT
jgi:hypothetical protein